MVNFATRLFSREMFAFPGSNRNWLVFWTLAYKNALEASFRTETHWRSAERSMTAMVTL